MQEESQTQDQVQPEVKPAQAEAPVESAPVEPDIERSKNTPVNKGGVRPGAGMPKGYVTKRVRDRQAVKNAILDRISKEADRLLDAQLVVALGATMLFKIEKDEKGNNKKPELVTDEHTIRRFIEECDGTDGTLDDKDYFFLTTTLPDSKAINSMFDRAFGKATEHMDVTSKGRAVQQPIVLSTIKPREAEANRTSE